MKIIKRMLANERISDHHFKLLLAIYYQSQNFGGFTRQAENLNSWEVEFLNDFYESKESDYFFVRFLITEGTKYRLERIATRDFFYLMKMGWSDKAVIKADLQEDEAVELAKAILNDQEQFKYSLEPLRLPGISQETIIAFKLNITQEKKLRILINDYSEKFFYRKLKLDNRDRGFELSIKYIIDYLSKNGSKLFYERVCISQQEIQQSINYSINFAHICKYMEQMGVIKIDNFSSGIGYSNALAEVSAKRVLIENIKEMDFEEILEMSERVRKQRNQLFIDDEKKLLEYKGNKKPINDATKELQLLKLLQSEEKLFIYKEIAIELEIGNYDTLQAHAHGEIDEDTKKLVQKYANALRVILQEIGMNRDQAYNYVANRSGGYIIQPSYL